jgi:hypothetical protein
VLISCSGSGELLSDARSPDAGGRPQPELVGMIQDPQLCLGHYHIEVHDSESKFAPDLDDLKS